MNFNPFFRKLWLIAIVLSCVGKSLDAISLDEDGYYDIVIAINEKTAQNANEKYLENLKKGIQDLSDALFESTQEKFSIRSADIVLPDHWQIDADAFATTQHYYNADIRIYHEYQVPEAINPTICGYPGNFIELPYNFFDEEERGPYGLTGKALLTLWARYRWGVHEEHGYPDDPTFPYFWKAYRLPEEPEIVPEDYRVTNCANTEIKGKFQNLDGEFCNATEDGLYPPPSDCRFIPDDANQTATTSLMSFHFIRTLTNFCDAETHNKRAPTRQNLYCRFLSIWEVMRESMDFKALQENSNNTRRPINFRILKQVSTPLLYILSDGVFTPPETVINGVAAGLDSIFNETRNWNVLASTNLFPSEKRTDSYDVLYPLNFPWIERERFVESFKNGFGQRDAFRTFAAAIQDIGTEVKERRHKAGAIILVLKFGEPSDYFFPAYESEVLGTILEQNIRVFALEGSDYNTLEPALKRITTLSGGLHFLIGTGEDDETNVATVISEIDEILKAGSLPPSRYRVVHKDSIMYDSRNSGNPFPISVPYSNVKKLMFFISLLNVGYTSNQAITKGPENVNLPYFSETYNWGKSEFSVPHYYAEIEQSFSEPTEWEYAYDCGSTECISMMVAIVELEEAPSSPIPGDDIEITVTTSNEEDSIADLNVESATSLKGTEFAIYARLEKNGHPINSPNLTVTAHVSFFSDDASFGGLYPKIVPLLDDGAGNPDLTANDGIYSGSILPISYPGGERGVYQITVSASHRPQQDGGQEKAVKTLSSPRNSTKTSPLPVDQVSIGCGSGYQGCFSERVTEPFMKYADRKRRIEFRGTDTFFPGLKAAASRILDFRVEPLPNAADMYRFSWTEPKRMSEYGAVRAESYEIYYTEDFNKLFSTVTDMNRLVGLPTPIAPGRTLEYDAPIEPSSKRYYVMRAFAQENAPTPVLSNVIFLHAQNPYPTTTTTTPNPDATSSTTASPSTTSMLPTKEPTSTTVPSLSTTTPTTLATSSTTRRTTTRTTPTTTTTTPTTTTMKFETTTQKKKSWIKSTGAIAVFTTFGVVTLALIGGGFVYFRMVHGG